MFHLVIYIYKNLEIRVNLNADVQIPHIMERTGTIAIVSVIKLLSSFYRKGKVSKEKSGEANYSFQKWPQKYFHSHMFF